MVRLKRCILFCSIVLLVNIFYLQHSQATSPGQSINKLKEKELSATLYVISIALQSSKLKGVEFVWIPDSIEEKCINKNYKSCRELSHGLKNKLFKKYPKRVLTSWISAGDTHIFPENKQILEELSKIDFIKDLMKEYDGEHHFDIIEEEKKIKAYVHWELWPNGENFRVLKIINK